MPGKRFPSLAQKAVELGLEPRPHFRRSLKGIFAGKVIQYGNMKPKSNTKTRRSWLPNIHIKFLYSRILGKRFRVQVTTNALRTIDKNGGLDEYLLNTRDKKIDSMIGVEIKREIQKKLGLTVPTKEDRIAHRIKLEATEKTRAATYAKALTSVQAAAAFAEAQATLAAQAEPVAESLAQ